MPKRTAELARRASAMDGTSQADEGGASDCERFVQTPPSPGADLSRQRER
jgi:hypothetical protein